jgi:heme/copper-type cytochrome/quinol oxidase subunit 2
VLLWAARAAALAALVLGVAVLFVWVRRVRRSVDPGEDRNNALERVWGWAAAFIVWCALVTSFLLRF